MERNQLCKELVRGAGRMPWAEAAARVLGEERETEQREAGGWLVTELCGPDEAEEVAAVISLLN